MKQALRWWRAGCLVVLCSLTVLLAGVVVVVHLATAWITDHACAVWSVAGLAVAGGLIGRWVASQYARRRQVRGTDE